MLYVLAGLVVLGMVPIVGLTLLSLTARPPESLGLREGRLADCPATPNCVATQSGTDSQRRESIGFDGSAAEAMRRLKAVLAEMPRLRVVDERGDYLRAEATSRVFRFVDDVEFHIDAENRTIHFRSASRAGRSDFGANRRRMEDIRRRFREHSD
jgi:uncharacterized protein (DUF1499 family)